MIKGVNNSIVITIISLEKQRNSLTSTLNKFGSKTIV